jgi:hypothetical protein
MSAKQETELRQALSMVQARGGEMPPFAWVTVGGEIVPMPAPDESWIARRMHDGYVVVVGSPVTGRERRRVPTSGNRLFRLLAAGNAGAAVQP